MLRDSHAPDCMTDTPFGGRGGCLRSTAKHQVLQHLLHMCQTSHTIHVACWLLQLLLLLLLLLVLLLQLLLSAIRCGCHKQGQEIIPQLCSTWRLRGRLCAPLPIHALDGNTPCCTSSSSSSSNQRGAARLDLS
jgi:hypothetical protein